MSDAQEEVKKESPLESFLKIKDIQDNVIYTTTVEELKDILSSVLLTGVYVKTFSLFNGMLELTYQSITDSERSKGYEMMRKFADANENTSRVILDSYTAKINIALQLVRISIKGNVTNVQNGSLEERVQLLSEFPEDTVRVCNKYLMIFANLTAKAFSSEEVLKN